MFIDEPHFPSDKCSDVEEQVRAHDPALCDNMHYFVDTLYAVAIAVDAHGMGLSDDALVNLTKAIIDRTDMQRKEDLNAG